MTDIRYAELFHPDRLGNAGSVPVRRARKTGLEDYVTVKFRNLRQETAMQNARDLQNAIYAQAAGRLGFQVMTRKR